MAKVIKTYSGDTFRNLLKQYKRDRIKSDPEFAAAVDAARFPKPAQDKEAA